MKDVKPMYLFGGLALAALALYFILVYINPSNVGGNDVKLSKKQEKKAQATIEKQNERAKRDTVASAALHKRAERREVNIQQMRQEAVILHKKSISHASPVPTTDTAIARLQERFSTYGDKPARTSKANLR